MKFDSYFATFMNTYIHFDLRNCHLHGLLWGLFDKLCNTPYNSSHFTIKHIIEVHIQTAQHSFYIMVKRCDTHVYALYQTISLSYIQMSTFTVFPVYSVFLALFNTIANHKPLHYSIFLAQNAGIRTMVMFWTFKHLYFIFEDQGNFSLPRHFRDGYEYFL